MLAARIQALAPAPDDVFVVARIDDARLTLTAGRAGQGNPPRGVPTSCGLPYYKALEIGQAKTRAASLLARRSNLEHLRPAFRALALCGGSPVFHRDLDRVFDLTLGLALHTIGFSWHVCSLRSAPWVWIGALYSQAPFTFPLVEPLLRPGEIRVNDARWTGLPTYRSGTLPYCGPSEQYRRFSNTCGSGVRSRDCAVRRLRLSERAQPVPTERP